ncbi:MAG TPA: prepilin-type N-terminal cleavage/methylation domain-containing protein [Gemmatimonadaceae bacterium]
MTHAPASRLPRRSRRSGITLIEIVVACTLLAVSLTALTGVTTKLAARVRTAAYTEQRAATFYQEVNRVESMMYDSLGTYLVSDSVKSSNVWYVWSYTVADSTSATGISKYKLVTLTVTPRVTGMTAQTGKIRRAKPPVANALNYP